MAALAQYQERLREVETCRWCETDISTRSIAYYPHPGGYLVDDLNGGPHWLYVKCVGCDYEWSFRKLGIPQL